LPPGQRSGSGADRACELSRGVTIVNLGTICYAHKQFNELAKE